MMEDLSSSLLAFKKVTLSSGSVKTELLKHLVMCKKWSRCFASAQNELNSHTFELL